MSGNEIAVPKEVREFMPDGAEETLLGQKNGARRQYRYGNLHIREYDDKFLVHTDRVDPRRNPVGHLIIDAPEVLAGLACAILSGSQASGIIPGSKPSLASRLAASAIYGYAGYVAAKKIKDYMGKHHVDT